MINPSAQPADLVGQEVWFIQNQIHIRSGKVRTVAGMQLAIDSGHALHLLHRREAFATEAAALRFHAQRLTEEIAQREAARTNALHRLAEIGESTATLVVVAACDVPPIDPRRN